MLLEVTPHIGPAADDEAGALGHVEEIGHSTQGTPVALLSLALADAAQYPGAHEHLLMLLLPGGDVLLPGHCVIEF